MKKLLIGLAISAFGLLLASGCSNVGSNPLGSSFTSNAKGNPSGALSTLLDNDGHPWGNHSKPWDFIWDNGLDNNHEFKTLGNGNILGFMYITFTEADTATGGQDVVGWKVHGKPAEAHWDDTENMWVVSAGDVPHQPGFVHWHPLGDEGEAQGMDSAPGYFLKHTATISFYFTPQSRWVEEGIDFDFPANYITE